MKIICQFFTLFSEKNSKNQLALLNCFEMYLFASEQY